MGEIGNIIRKCLIEKKKGFERWGNKTKCLIDLRWVREEFERWNNKRKNLSKLRELDWGKFRVYQSWSNF